MKGFERRNQLFSLCGLNCGLCPMRLGNYCGGCGNGNQSCGIAKCSLEHGKIEYCYECKQYPCEKYQHIDKYDSFITHRRRNADLERAQSMGIEQYNAEQQEKIQILSHLLSNYNDGRRKNFFLRSSQFIRTSELQEALKQIQSNDELSALPFKAQCSYVVEVLQKIADKKIIKLKLIKKNSTFLFVVKIAKPAEPVNGKMNDAFHAPPLTVPPAFADRQSRRESLKMASPHFNFERKIRLLFRECGYPFGTLCPIVRRGTRDGASYTPCLPAASNALAFPDGNAFLRQRRQSV